LQRAISCGYAHEDIVAAYELARTHSCKDKYTVDDTEVAKREGRLVLRVLCVPDMYLSPCSYVFTILVLGLCI